MLNRSSPEAVRRGRSSLRAATNVALNTLVERGSIAGSETAGSRTDCPRRRGDPLPGFDIAVTRAEVMNALGRASEQVEVAIRLPSE